MILIFLVGVTFLAFLLVVFLAWEPTLEEPALVEPVFNDDYSAFLVVELRP